MITCQHARHLFDSYLDGELSSSLQTELHAHRLNCTACQNELALLEACGDVIAMDRRESQLSASFTDRIVLAQRGRQLPKRRRWGRTALLVGSPLAAAASVVFMLSVVSAPAGSMRPTAIDPKIVVAPKDMRDKMLQMAGRQATPEETQSWQQVNEMSPSAFAEALEGAGEGVKSKLEGWRRVVEESGRLMTGYSNEKFAALRQSMQREKKDRDASAADLMGSDIDSFGPPAYLNPPPVVPDTAGQPDFDRPAEAF